MDLFTPASRRTSPSGHVPLAARLRPRTVGEFVGQDHLLGTGKPLRVLIEEDNVPSLIFWGPPGSGKTTLARIIAEATIAEFFQLSAVASGVKDLRSVLDRALAMRRNQDGRSLLFIDEIHRFNKTQQDALLHAVEDGVITLIGATTENPSFEVIGPLLSRCRVYVLYPLSNEQLEHIVDHALSTDPFLKERRVVVTDTPLLIRYAGGDARRMLNGLETAVSLARSNNDGSTVVGSKELEEAFQLKVARYDKAGEEHYEVISAYIKSIRGCDPDAAVYWLARMLEGGEDPKFIARRMIILASEDIGNADPYALTLATSCFTAVEYIGMPEARIVLAQAATYLASCPKSNASYAAINAAQEIVRKNTPDPVPLHLRNAPTSLMKEMHYGKDYKYNHDYAGNFVEQEYAPESLHGMILYHPTENGEEKNIRTRLMQWWKSRKRT